ncbi:MAG: RDD family protein [Candidatus Roizmanbacteria bacterium]
MQNIEPPIPTAPIISQEVSTNISPPQLPDTIYAGFWIRFAAGLIDSFILFAINMLITFMSVFAIRQQGETMIPFLSYLIGPAYYIGFWVYNNGATPGKKAVNIKVVRTDGLPITMSTGIIRYIGYVLSGIILGIGYVMIGLDIKKQGLHDKIANTYVVRS